MLPHSGRTIVCLLVSCLTAVAAEPAASEQQSAELFEQRVAPILETHCVRCHGPQQQESSLRLDRPDSIRQGGDRGPALVAGDAASSWLYRAVCPEDEELQMPPEGEPLAADDVRALKAWIESGAIWPARITKLTARFTLSDEDRNYWAFLPPADVTVPASDDERWSRNEVDRFVLQGMRQAGLQPRIEADRHTLVRRIFYDLIGLPPTPEELDAFLQDDHPLAYERLVDHLLDRPEYGQRWARYWLDLVRYAESDGFKADVYRPHAWLYRDYVVRSLCDDKPYDRFLQEQLAGDELFPDDPQARIATGYLRLWPLEDNQKDVQRQWTLVLDDVTEVTSEVVLGLGLRCAKCHDHKYDPIPQSDYFRLRAFFASMLPRDDLQVPLSDEMHRLRHWEDETRPIRRAMRQMENLHVSGLKQTIRFYPPYLQAIYDTPPEQWSPLDQQYAYLARPQIDKTSTDELKFKEPLRANWQQLKGKLQQHASDRPDDVVTAMTVTDVGPVAPPTYVANDPQQGAVEPGYLTALHVSDVAIEPMADNPQTTGRRAALARWLTQPDHPLTARVMVNRMWQQHFGRGIVDTANDFGRQGTPPTHPELLDWLARRFVADGWSLKKLHRLLVTSATYRQAPLRDADDVALCQSLYCGYWPRRLEGEQIRDGMLLASGELQPYRAEPSVDGEQPVRSIMIKSVRNKPDEWLNAFDGPDMFNSCARRFVTTTPLQSLLVVNSRWSLQRAEALARRIRNSSTPQADRWVTEAFQRTLSREPEPRELAESQEFIEDDGQPSAERLVDFCHVLFCSNEFVYVD
jgi:hypothetical protein